MLLINISAPLPDIDSDEAAPTCPVAPTRPVKVVLNFFLLQNSSENTCTGVSF